MDLKTSLTIKRINLYFKIKKYLTALCYSFIACGVLIYIFYALNKTNQNYKLVSDYKKNPEQFIAEKIMTNPRIKFQYSDNQIYEIEAKRAVHKDEEEVTLFDVYASGQVGNITAGKLKINENGNHLVFTENPVLILNKGDL